SIPPSSVTGQTLRWATDKPAHQPSKSRKPATRRAFHLTDVEDFRAAFIIVIIVEVVVIHLVGGLDARTAQRALIVELLQTGTRLILDLLIELGQRFGVGRLFRDTLGTLIEVAHDRLTQLLRTLTLKRGDDEYRALPVETLYHLPHALLSILLEQLVSLVQNQPTVTLSQCRTEFLQLIEDDLGGIGRIALIQRCHVHQMQQQPRARQMLEETNSQTRALRSAFDQPRNVGNHKTLVAPDTDDTQVRDQGRERII